MRNTGLLFAAAAAPAAAAVSYAVLTGYLLKRVKPLPISVMPWPDEKQTPPAHDKREAVPV